MDNAHLPEPPAFDHSADLESERLRTLERKYVSENIEVTAPTLGLERSEALRRGFLSGFLKFERTDVLTRDHGDRKNVLIFEGDSWFNHPLLRDISEEVERFGYPILHSNRPGKLLRESATEKRFLSPLRDHRKTQIAALMLSGGGNDLINWEKGQAEFSPIFQPGNDQNPSSYLNHTVLDRFLRSMRRYLREIKDELDRLEARIPVFLHCYDVIRPREYPMALLKGDWIDRQLDIVGVPDDSAFRYSLAQELIGRWQQSYQQAAEDLGFVYIDLAGVVQQRWYDEIHPRYPAFYDIAVRFWNALHLANIRPQADALNV